jgi:hypothetical protein
MSKSPCKNCPDRALNCHSSCSKYQEFANGREVMRKEHRQLVDVIYGINEVRQRSVKRSKDESLSKFKCHKK